MKKRFALYVLGICMSLIGNAQSIDDLSNGKARNIFELLRTIPGIEITGNAGGRGQQQVFIREARNLKSKIPAIFVVDKVIYDGDITNINPIDIAGISVLKDAASASVYGARGFGGVVVITTKSGNGVVPPTVKTYEKSAYQYFIEQSTELRIVGKDGKTLASGLIKKETDSSIFLRKKEILKKDIEKVEIITQ
jgi:TonB-dependent SusC/RagA subfamily outer membrane receptor